MPSFFIKLIPSICSRKDLYKTLAISSLTLRWNSVCL